MDNFIPLESIHIASPCQADWDAMTGDSRARFCDTCQKSVYNLSDMTRAQAQALVIEKEGKMCVQFYQRADGTMLIDDCPVPLRPARNCALSAWRCVTAAAVAVAALCSGLLPRASEAAPEAAPKVASVKHFVAKLGEPRPNAAAAKAPTAKQTHTKHRIGKGRNINRMGRVVPPWRRRASVQGPVQPTAGMQAPVRVNAVPRKPVAVFHPDKGQGGARPIFRGEMQANVVHVPARRSAPQPVKLMGKPAPMPAPTPKPAH